MAKKKYNLPTRKLAEWASEVTGKPEVEWWFQGMFYLTEIEGLSSEEAGKILSENWEK